MKIEYRESTLVEFKFADGDGTMTFSGYASTFGGPPDSYGDVVARGAFRETVSEAKRTSSWPAMLLNHGGGFLGGGADDMTPVGIWTEMREDERGLVVDGRFADTDRGRDLYTLMKMTPRPAINGLSIGFRAKRFTMGTKANEPRRTLEVVDLVEISIVTRPANQRARVTSVKAEERFHPTALERLLREAGYSKREATAIVAHGLKSAASLRDADSDAAEAARAILQRAEQLQRTLKGQ